MRIVSQAKFGISLDPVVGQPSFLDPMRHGLGYGHAGLWDWRVCVTEHMSSSSSLIFAPLVFFLGHLLVKRASCHEESPQQLMGSPMFLLCGLRSKPALWAEHGLSQCLSRGRGGSRNFEDQMDTRGTV